MSFSFFLLSHVGIDIYSFSGKELPQEQSDAFICNKFRSANGTSRQHLGSLIRTAGASSSIQHLIVCPSCLFPFRFMGWFWLLSTGSPSTSATTWIGKANTPCKEGRSLSPRLPYQADPALSVGRCLESCTKPLERRCVAHLCAFPSCTIWVELCRTAVLNIHWEWMRTETHLGLEMQVSSLREGWCVAQGEYTQPPRT